MDITAASRKKLKMGLSGPEGLICSIILQAVTDATGRNPEIAADARQYLTGPLFRQDLAFLGINPELAAELL